VSKGGKVVQENKTKTAGAYPPQLCEKWSKILAEIAPEGSFGSDGSHLEWFNQQLATAATRSCNHVGPSWAQVDSKCSGISDADVEQAFGKGIVFGQHSKSEARAIAGEEVDLSCPKQKLAS